MQSCNELVGVNRRSSVASRVRGHCIPTLEEFLFKSTSTPSEKYTNLFFGVGSFGFVSHYPLLSG